VKVGIVGAGILGLSLGYRLAKRGHTVEIFDASPDLGGLAAAQDYGPFVWDRFYHCILPTDQHLIGLLRELGLGDELRWTNTGTGYYARGRFHDMNGNADFLRFPLLSLVDKARLGAMIVYATRFADPWKLYRVSAQDWLTRICGRRAYEVFWRPLLKAKFGPFYDQIAAVFIWATLTRLFGARSTTTAQEKMGYCSGGYARILGRMREALESKGAAIHLAAPVLAIRPGGQAEGGVSLESEPTGPRHFDQVFFTGPTRLAKKAAAPAYHADIDRVARDHPTSAAYLGVACLVLALKRKLTPYYVLNIGEESVKLTGLIEMTNLIDPNVETKGLSLVYLPQYMDSADPRFDEPDEVLSRTMIDQGIKRLFADFDPSDVVYGKVHRARYVQPLPLVRNASAAPRAAFPRLERPFQVLNTSMLTCATLNNNEVVAFVDKFLDESATSL